MSIWVRLASPGSPQNQSKYCEPKKFENITFLVEIYYHRYICTDSHEIGSFYYIHPGLVLPGKISLPTKQPHSSDYLILSSFLKFNAAIFIINCCNFLWINTDFSGLPLIAYALE